MTLIEIVLGLAALYAGGMWLVQFVVWVRNGFWASEGTEANTFHLGLCFILAIGFLGLLLK